MPESSKTSSDREILVAAHEKGLLSTFGAFFRLSGPGWLQSAITLGGGSLGSALYLGVLCGTSMMWLPLLAIVVGVIMLTSISYVVLSSGERPLKAINEHVNPVLGVGWVTATILANMIWVLPQFSLCFDIGHKILLPDTIQDTDVFKYGISVGLFLLAAFLVFLNLKGGWASRIFDILLKLIVGAIVLSFVAVVVSLYREGYLDFNSILAGLIPRPEHWFSPVSSVSELVSKLPESSQEYWSTEFVTNQRNVLISTTATVVGINMTFLLPYSMLNRGWDRPFRGLATFDLITGLAIPFVIVFSCIVIASGFNFHAKADENFLSDDPALVQQSPVFGSASGILLKSLVADDTSMDISELTETQVANLVSQASQEDRTLAAMLVKPDSAMLAKSLEPLLGPTYANLVFGLGAFGMGFSTIIILMMINGFAVSELFGMPRNITIQMLGAVLAGLIGVMWPMFWAGESKTWLIILASTFGAILLPIAYIAFFALMNNRTLLKDDMLTGAWRWIWNALMALGVLAALAQAGSALYTKLFDPTTGSLIALQPGSMIFGGIVTFALLALIGFSATKGRQTDSHEE